VIPTALAGRLLAILLVATMVVGILAAAVPEEALADGPGSSGETPNPGASSPGGLSSDETLSGGVWLTLVRCLLLLL
jgi:hypothetical protein